jgi:hypothetical protein
VLEPVLKEIVEPLPTLDYNGVGRWSLETVQRRYAEYSRRFQVAKPLVLTPLEVSDGTTRRIYPVMQCVIDGIKTGDAACVELGVEFIECDEKIPFGKALKAAAARALRKVELTHSHIERIRKRVTQMLVAEVIPHEFGDYARLLRKVGVGPDWQQVAPRINRSNRYVMKFFRYLDASVMDSAPSCS